MRTQALRVSAGCYSDGRWHVALIVDIYERGVLVNSQIEQLRHVDSYGDVEHLVLEELRHVRRMEAERVAADAVRSAQAAHRTAAAH